MNGFVVSDLHLFSRWSSFKKIDLLIRSYLKKSDIFIFNGDIFDFKWTVHGSVELSIKKALNWLNQLAIDFPDCNFIFIFGNHDSHKDFVSAIDDFAKTKNNFDYHLAYVQIGSNLFLHGDLPIINKGNPLLKRERFLTKQPKNIFLSYLYFFLISMRAHNFISFYFTPERSAGIIHHAIINEKKIFNLPIQDVYFGHTHAAFEEFTIDGICYHNSGALINKQKFSILPVVC